MVIDEYSKYPEIDIIHSTSATAVIPKMDQMFATHGIPYKVKTNGPPFQGEDFKTFSKVKGFEHRRITPYWPKQTQRQNVSCALSEKPLVLQMQKDQTGGWN